MTTTSTEGPFFERPLPEVLELGQPLSGKLFVIEGADGSGRSTQIRMLTRWLEAKGHAVRTMGINRSSLAADHLTLAKQSNTVTNKTMALFYATDFFDQLVTEIVPALAAGTIVIADRYIYTLMARARVRGADADWLRNIYGPAVVPDAVFYFELSGNSLLERYINKSRSLDYWESGMDLGLHDDMFDSFIKYQSLMNNEFQNLKEVYDFDVVDGKRPVYAIQRTLRKRIKPMLAG